MCDWNAAELLGSWRDRALPELERLGACDLRVTEDGWKATLELKNDALVASITAWSTGMLELSARATDQGDAGEPEVVTEQRDSAGRAEALLDEWVRRLSAGGAS